MNSKVRVSTLARALSRAKYEVVCELEGSFYTPVSVPALDKALYFTSVIDQKLRGVMASGATEIDAVEFVSLMLESLETFTKSVAFEERTPWIAALNIVMETIRGLWIPLQDVPIEARKALRQRTDEIGSCISGYDWNLGYAENLRRNGAFETLVPPPSWLAALWSDLKSLLPKKKASA
jgi:hypothetical protein